MLPHAQLRCRIGIHGCVLASLKVRVKRNLLFNNGSSVWQTSGRELLTTVLNMEVLILNPSMVAFSSSTVALGRLDPLVMGLISTCSLRSGSSSVCKSHPIIKGTGTQSAFKIQHQRLRDTIVPRMAVLVDFYNNIKMRRKKNR